MAQPAASRPQPRPVDLNGIDPTHPENEDSLQLIGTAVAETAAGVTGVHHLGGTAARSLDRASRAVLGRDTGAGVTVSQEQGVTTIDVDIVVEYPSKVTEVADETRTQVTRAASLLTTDSVVVNVTVTDVFAPGDRDVVAEADAAISGAVEKTKETAGRAAEKTRKAAADLAETSRDTAAQVREKTAGAAEEIKAGAARAVDAAREGASRASDATREGAARASEAIDDGVKRARDAAADATDRLDRELAEKRAGNDSSDSPSSGDADVTVVVKDSATVLVDAESDVTVTVEGSGTADVVKSKKRPKTA